VKGLVLAAAIVAAQPAQQPRPEPPPQAPAPLSERQEERITQQERLIACNRKGREAGLHGAQRTDFVRECLKDNNAAVGGDRPK
jgi:hypothetical protein